MVHLKICLVCGSCFECVNMRQKVDHKFIEILNNIRIGKAIDVDLDLLAKRKTNIDKVKTDTALLYAENGPTDS